MSGPREFENEALVLDLVEWIAARPRTYTEVMAAWRTSCPRLPVWEDAVGHGLLDQRIEDGNAHMVYVAPDGIAFLRSRGRA